MQKKMFKQVVHSFKRETSRTAVTDSLIVLVQSYTKGKELTIRQRNRKRADTAAQLSVDANHIFQAVGGRYEDVQNTPITADGLHDVINEDGRTAIEEIIQRICTPHQGVDIAAIMAFPVVVGDELDDMDDEWYDYFVEDLGDTYMLVIEWVQGHISDSTVKCTNIQHYLEVRLGE